MKKTILFITLVLGIIAYFFFNYLMRTAPTDLQPHAIQVQNLQKGITGVPPIFLYYIIVWLFAGFSTDIIIIKQASVVVLAIALGFKFWTTQYIIKDYLVKILNKSLTNKQIYIVLFFSILLLFVFVLPDAWYYASKRQSYYLGRLVPNVWHNSTIIFYFLSLYCYFGNNTVFCFLIKNLILSN